MTCQYNPDDYYFFFKHKIAQWTYSPFELDGVKYNCMEQYMMYQKALLFNDKEIADKILNSDDPSEQKSLGRQVNGFNEETWCKHREYIVYTGNLAKFDQNADLRKVLFETGNKQLVEVNPVDFVWGIGLNKQDAMNTPPSEWKGLNLLGKILTKVRQHLREIYTNEVLT